MSETDTDDLLGSSSQESGEEESDKEDTEGSGEDGGGGDSIPSSDEELPEVSASQSNSSDKPTESREKPSDANKDTIKDSNNNKNARQYPSWNGERLHPPLRKSSKPSKAWKFGGFRKNKRGEIISAVTVCGLCGEEKKYKNTPSHLLQHLMSCHENEFFGENDKPNQPSLPDFFKKVSEKPTEYYKGKHPKQVAFRKTLVEWIIDSNRPFKAVEDKKLMEAFKLADPKLKTPSYFQVRGDIKNLEAVKKEEMKESFKAVDHFSCSNDAGSSLDGRSFVDVNVHWISEDFQPQKKILSVLEMKEDKTAKNYRKAVDSKLEEFDIKSKVFNFTTDNENTMRAAFNDEERNGCLAHIESKSGKKALESVKVINDLRKKLRKISKKGNKSSKFKYSLQRQQKQRKLKVRSLKQEIKTRFVGTNAMMRSVANDLNEGTNSGIDINSVERNVEAINAAMVESKFPKNEVKKLTITKEDVKKLVEVIPILDALDEGVNLVGGEKYATGSVVLPFLSKFHKLLETDEEDPLYLSKFKETMSTDLKERCEKNLNFNFLAKATFFDKRFFSLKSVDSDEKS